MFQYLRDREIELEISKTKAILAIHQTLKEVNDGAGIYCAPIQAFEPLENGI
jgi:hypothetical protein